MKTVTLDVMQLSGSLAEFARVWKSGRGETSARISFDSPELLWKVLTARRWDLLRALAGQGPISLREAARRVQKGVQGVHTDVHALLHSAAHRRRQD